MGINFCRRMVNADIFPANNLRQEIMVRVMMEGCDLRMRELLLCSPDCRCEVVLQQQTFSFTLSLSYSRDRNEVNFHIFNHAHLLTDSTWSTWLV